MQRRLIGGSLLGLVLLLALLASCASNPKATFVKLKSTSVVKGVGYSWGEDAEKNAKKNALKEASAIAQPSSIEFTYMQEGPYTIFRTKEIDQSPAEIISTKQLDDGGYMAIAKANRTGKALKKVQYTRFADITVEDKSEKFQSRALNSYALALEEAITQSAEYKYGKVPPKMKGQLTFHSISRMDDGKKMRLRMAVYVGFIGQGSLSKQERAMVYMNAWRQACCKSRGEIASVLYEKAVLIYPNADYYEEFASWAIVNDHLKQAIVALEKANNKNPYNIKYLKKLYQLYSLVGYNKKAKTAEAKLIELEAFEENLGTDLSEGLRYHSKIRWSTDGEEEDPEGTIHFTDVDDEELEEQIKNAKVREE